MPNKRHKTLIIKAVRHGGMRIVSRYYLKEYRERSTWHTYTVFETHCLKVNADVYRFNL